MDKNEEFEKVTFKKHYKALSSQEQKQLRDDFLRETGIAYPTFYSKLSRESYTILERKLLDKLCCRKFSW